MAGSKVIDASIRSFMAGIAAGMVAQIPFDPAHKDKMSDNIIALVIWYAREGLGRHVQVLCSEAIRRKRGDVALQLWRAYGLCIEGSYSEALRELQALSNNQGEPNRVLGNGGLVTLKM